MKRATFLMVLLGLAVIAPLARAQQAQQSEREAMYYRYLEFASYVKGGSIEPHWMADGARFWYTEGDSASTAIWRVDPKVNIKTPFFDTARLREALTEVLGYNPAGVGVPFDTFTFLDGEQAVTFAVADKQFILELDTYTVKPAPIGAEPEETRFAPRPVPHPFIGFSEMLSPDRSRFVTLNDHNVWLRSTVDESLVQLTTDGTQDYEWGHDIWNQWTQWSPDSTRLAVAKIDLREYPRIPILHYLGSNPAFEWAHEYNPNPFAEGYPQTEVFILDTLSKQPVRVDTGAQPHYFLYPAPGWRSDGRELLFQKMSLDSKTLEVLAASPETGSTRVVLTETQEKYLSSRPPGALFYSLLDGERFIWISERNGWRHLYLYNIDGTLIRQLTQGDFPVLEVVDIDATRNWVYFTAHGDPQRPYDTHLYRVNLSGEEFQQLTVSPGQHAIQFAPSKDFFLDTHSSVVRPPAVELRKADGTLLETLSRADIASLIADLKWTPPEEFVVKAADGQTDLYGVLYKPHDLDPDRKYPVIEVIYGGPQTSVFPGSFTRSNSLAIAAIDPRALAQLGFVTFYMDARGTPGRGKQFQDIVYGNEGRYEIPDHVAGLRQLAETRPYMDLSRVGLTGISRGGYMTIRGLLLAPDVYHVGVASAPGEGLRFKAYMGSPVENEEGYSYASNVPLAASLQGKLLIIQGTRDMSAPFWDTMKVVDAFVRADKRFDLVVLPEQPHALFRGTEAGYWRDAIRRYFQEHLKP